MKLNEKKVALSAPWVSFYKEIEALFGEDPDIKVVFDEDAPEIKIYVDGWEKADALTQLLPAEKIYGRIVLRISVLPANVLEDDPASLFQKAFEGNPAFSYVKKVEGVFANPISYVVFQNKVVQYFNDDLGDINGNCSTLYQNIAKDVFGEIDGVFFCTDVEK